MLKFICMPVQICNIGEEICIILQCEGTKENKCKWSVPKNNLPASLQLEETTGKIWGTCVEECLKTVTIKVEDVKNGMYTYGNITFYIRNKIQAFEFLTKSLPSAYVGENYHQQIFCEGGIKPYCFYVDSLPHGMECSLNGIISGTPTVSGGCFPITIQATDAKETKIEQFLWLEMKEGKKERRKEGKKERRDTYD